MKQFFAIILISYMVVRYLAFPVFMIWVFLQFLKWAFPSI